MFSLLCTPSPSLPLSFSPAFVCLFQFVFQFPHKMQIMFSVCYTFSQAQSQIATDRSGLDWIRSGCHGQHWFGLVRIVLQAGPGLVPRASPLLRVVCHRFYRARSLFDFCITSVLLQFLRISTNNQICIHPMQIRNRSPSIPFSFTTFFQFNLFYCFFSVIAVAHSGKCTMVITRDISVAVICITSEVNERTWRRGDTLWGQLDAQSLLTLWSNEVTNIQVDNHKLLIMNLLFSLEVISKHYSSNYKLFFFYFHLNTFLLSLILLTQLNYFLSLHMFSYLL